MLSERDPGPEDQTVPGIPGASELVVVTRRKGRETAADEFHAAARVLQGPEWEEAAKLLVDKRKSRAGLPASGSPAGVARATSPSSRRSSPASGQPVAP